VNAPSELFVHLAMLITGMFCHGFVFNDMKTSCIIPIPKSNQSVCASANYSGIALIAGIGKLVDNIVLERVCEYLIITDLQFGFKHGHLNNMCTMILKETVAYYTWHQCCTYFILLDTRKAFDHINCFREYRIVTKFLIKHYLEQYAYINWNTLLPHSFTILNGVRHGIIILSAHWQNCICALLLISRCTDAKYAKFFEWVDVMHFQCLRCNMASLVKINSSFRTLNTS
jgi:Reverse transcriptase (RNA-dependent DNA polymerase)